MSRQIYRIAFVSLFTLGLFTGNTETFASIPPHKRVAKLLKEKKINTPYYLQNRKELSKRGVNVPWASPSIRKPTLKKQAGISRSLGATSAPRGSWKALVLLVKFTDKTQNTNPVMFDSLLFGVSAQTLRDYYKAVSYDNLDIVTVNMPSSVGWNMAPQTYSYYVNGQNGFGTYPQNAQKLAEDVLAAADSSVDFSQYDNDHDGYVDALFIIHTGTGAEFTGSNFDIWSHSWVTNTPQFRDGVYLYQYSMEPEYWATPGDMTCGVFAHELGHVAFGLPDLYDNDYSSEGIGSWTLMAGGSWNGATGLGESPSFPDAWSHVQMGFLSPINITSNLYSQSITNVENVPQAFRLWTNGSIGNEYFLVQNRQQVGYDSYLPGNGLLVYHVDESVVTGNDNEWYPGHTALGHYLVALEQADGVYGLEKKLDGGDVGDPYPGSMLNRNITSSTSPNSDTYPGVATHVSVTNISNSNLIMVADLQVGLMTARPHIVVSPDTVKSGVVVVGHTRYDTVFVKNSGSENLIIDSITSTLPVYTPHIKNFTVPAGGVQPVVLTFAPTDSISYNGTLTITSNDTASGVVGVVVLGKGVHTPLVTVAPDSFVVSIAQNDSTVRTMTIGNAGQGNLDWNITGGGPPIGDDSITTTFIGGNGQNGNMFDITAIKTITITGFDVHPQGNADFEIYYKSGTYVGYENNSAAWTLAARFPGVVAQPSGTPTPLPHTLAIIIPKGETYGLYVTASNGSVNYTNGTAVGNVYVADANLQVKEGCGLSYPFFGSPFTPRIWNGRIHYAGGGNTFVAVTPISGSVPSGLSQDVTVKFNAKNLSAGDYRSILTIASNDPLDSLKNVPANLQVIGRPVIVATPDTVESGIAFIGKTKTDTIKVRNIGSQPLIVSNISSSISFFLPNITSFTVPAGGMQPVAVAFTPTDTIVYNGILTITSNDTTRGAVRIVLKGTGSYEPVITVAPDSFAVVIAQNDSTERTMTIGNTGLGNLSWSVGGIGGRNQSKVQASISSMKQRSVALTDSKPTRSISGELSVSSDMISHEPIKVYLNKLYSIPGGLNIAILGADGSGSTYLSDVARYFIGSGRFNSVTTINGYVITPTLTELQAYDAVIVFGWYSWANNIAIGNLLADYIDAHGNVLIALAANANNGSWMVSGRFNTDNYWLIQPNPGAGGSTSSMGVILHPEQQIMSGISTVRTGSKLNSYATVAPSATCLAKFTDGTPLIAIDQSRSGRRVDVSFPVISSASNSWGFDLTSNADELLIHAVEWLSTGDSRWITITPSSGTVASGTTQHVTVKFNAKDLQSGDYRSVVAITSNDPLHSVKEVPANLHVIGRAVIAVIPDTINAGSVYIGARYVDSVSIRNVGSDVLHVTDMTSSVSVFTTSLTNFNVQPRGEQRVEVRFTPTDSILYNGLLTITSNDSLRPTVGIVLQGKGIYPPIISLTPSSLNANLLTGQSTAQTVTVSNHGSSDLRFDATIKFSDSLSLSHSFLSKSPVFSSSQNTLQPGREYVPGQVIVKFKKGIAAAQAQSLRSSLHSTVVKKFPSINAELLQLSDVTVTNAISQYKDNSLIQYIEPNYIVHAVDRTPNDPMFPQLWGMQKISVPAAWDKTTGRNIVIGDIDTGIDTNHIDLKANLWTNPGEIAGNGIDDDGNGYIDDVHGWNFVSNTNNVYDDHSHGTHTAGTIAAVGNNSVGVVGVCWSAKIMALKFLDASGSGTTAAAISAIEYSTMMHARLTSNSWGGGGYSLALYDEIKNAGDAGALFVAAAGNSSMNTDVYLNYPSCYDLENIISVASTTSSDGLSSFSNYGVVTVDLGAPGSDILSTLPGNSYGIYSGTSMATPHVSGVAGLILSLNPLLSFAEIKNIILTSVDTIPSLIGKTVTGGRLNAAHALQKTQTWIKLNSITGTVPPGTSLDLLVTFDATGMNAGDYQSTISINSNDPVNNQKNISASLHVAGNPVIRVHPDTVKAGTAYIGINHTDSVTVENTGSDNLNVTNITSSLSVFTTSSTNFRVPPGGEKRIAVRFTPTDSVAYNGILTFTSNDSLHPTISVGLQGHGAYLPNMAVSPDSFAVTLLQNDSTERTMTIRNTGIGNLTWGIANGVTAAQNSNMASRTESELIAIQQAQQQGNNSGAATVSPYSLETLLASSGTMRVLLWTAYSDNSPGGETENTMNAIRLYKSDVVFDTTKTQSPVLFASRLAQADVLIMPEQENISNLTALGSAFSSALTSFVQSGRTIIVMDYFNYGSTTFLNGTGLLTINTLVPQSSLTAIVHETTSPLVTGVSTTFTAMDGSNYHSSPDGRKIIRDQSAGNNIVTLRDIGAGRVIYIGMDFFSYNTNMARVLANAVISSGSGRFISVQPNSGTVLPGTSQDVTVKFNAKNLQPGDYRSVVTITSNDTVHNPQKVPASMHVIGRPIIAITPDTVKFGIGFIGMTKIDTFRIQNTGSDILNVSNITSSLAAFSPGVKSFSVAAGSEYKVVVIFTPRDTIAYNGILTVMSNDSLRPAIGVRLQGRGEHFPVMTVTPDSFAVTLLQNDSTERTMTIRNTGIGNLTWGIANGVTAAQNSNMASRTESELIAIQQAQQQGNNSGAATVSPYSLETLLASSGTMRVLLWTAYSDNSPGGETENTMNAIRRYKSDVMFDTTKTQSPVLFASRLAQADVFIMPEQENISNLAALGSAFSSALTSFVQSGRTIIVMDYVNGGSTTFLNATGLLIITNLSPQISLTAVVHETSSPLVIGVSAPFTAMDGSNYHSSPNGRKIIREQSSGNNVVTQRDMIAGRVIYIGMDFYSYNSIMACVLANAVNSSQNNKWLSVQPISGTVLPGTSQDVTVKFNAKDLQEGDYRSFDNITSNDPVCSSKNIPINLNVKNIILSSPNGHENWLYGSRHNITWVSYHTSGNVRIEYSTDNGSSWSDVVVNTPDDGTHPWTIPNKPSTTYLVRISDTDGHPTDQSDAVFTISEPPGYIRDLRASLVNSHILLEWSSVPGAVGYNVYRGTQHDFVPDVGLNQIAANILDEAPGTPGIQWTDPSTTVMSDTATHHFWRIFGLCVNTMPRLNRHTSQTSITPSGVSHTVTGKVFNSDHGIPGDSAIQFEAYIVSRPGEVLNEAVVGCGYSSGYWFINTGSLPTAWSIGDTLHVDVRNVVNSQLGQLNLLLTGSDPDNAPDLNLSTIIEFGVSNVAGECTYPLHSTPGTDINEIVMGMDTRTTRNPILDAENLAQAIPYCTTVYSWNAQGQGFIGHVKGLPFNNFPVHQGYPYAVNVPRDTVWTVAGCLTDTNYHLITTPGTDINHIAIPFSKSHLVNADSLIRDIPGGTTVYYWSANAQATIGHVKGLPFNNFPVIPRYPYYANVTRDSVWPSAPLAVSKPIAFGDFSKKNFKSGSQSAGTLSKGTPSASLGINTAAPSMRPSGGVPHIVYGKHNARISGGIKMRVWITCRSGEVLNESFVGTGCDSTYWWTNIGAFPTSWQKGETLKIELEDSTTKMEGQVSIKLTDDGSDCADLINLDTPVQTLGIEHDGSDIPKEYSLVGNYPNPFNPTTTIVFRLPEHSEVTIEIFDIIGRLVKTFYNGTQKPGEYLLSWDGTNDNGLRVSSGVYFYKMKANTYVCSKKMLLIK